MITYSQFRILFVLKLLCGYAKQLLHSSDAEKRPIGFVGFSFKRFVSITCFNCVQSQQSLVRAFFEKPVACYKPGTYRTLERESMRDRRDREHPHQISDASWSRRKKFDLGKLIFLDEYPELVLPLIMIDFSKWILEKKGKKGECNHFYWGRRAGRFRRKYSVSFPFLHIWS